MPGIFERFKRGLQKTATAVTRHIQTVFRGDRPWTAADFDELEMILIQADMGVTAAGEITGDLRDRYARGLIQTSADLLRVAGEDIQKLLDGAGTPPLVWAPQPPTVILLTGVNGSGKTTTAAKLACRWRDEGKQVMFAACDTFRAAAIAQLKVWGERLDVPVIAHQHGADAAAVAFDAATAARQRRADVLLIDTAGRQHTRKTLMDELGKIKRTLEKACPGAPHENWLVVDASIGTNAITQAREFNKAIPVTGLVLTKLDGTGKGGAVVAIRRELGYPVRFVGLGEAQDDLQPFQSEAFARAILDRA